MEKIKINDIQLKGPAKTICVVNYNDGKEATLNTKWQEQEVDFLQKDVGIGGTVSVLIVPKGQYTNITEVDMTSGVKGTIESPENQQIDARNANLMSQKEIGMCAGGMLKCMYYNKTPESAEEVLDMYHKFVLELEQNG